jgi:hypothetical protein
MESCLDWIGNGCLLDVGKYKNSVFFKPMGHGEVISSVELWISPAIVAFTGLLSDAKSVRSSRGQRLLPFFSPPD